MANEIISEIRLELDKFRADLKQAEKDGKESGTTAGKGFGDNVEGELGKAFGGVKTAFAALAATIGGIFTLKESIAAASEQENAIQKLNASMALSGTFTDAASQHFQDFAGALQKTTTASDDAIERGASLLVTMGNLSGPTLDRATKASLDLAAALGIDVDTAFQKVAKAADGQVSSLSKYGIQVKETGDRSADFANALGQLEGRFKGFAEIQANTFSGALTQTKNQFGEVLESIGNVIIKSPAMIAILKVIANAFESVANGISAWAGSRDIIGEVTSGLITLGKALVQYVIAPAELAFNIFSVAFNAIKTLIQGVISTLAQDLSTFTGLFAPLGGKFAEIDASVKSFASSSTAVLDDFATQTQQSASNIFNFDAASKADAYLKQVDEFMGAVKPPLQAKFQELSDAANSAKLDPNLFSAFAAGFMANTKSMIKGAQDLGAQIKATLNVGVTNAFAAFGAAIVNGQNGFAAFGKAVLGVIGDIAIQMGAFFIAAGIGKALMFDPTGPALIIAGASLAILGGALKAFAGGGGVNSAAVTGTTPPGGVATGDVTGTASPVTNGTQLNSVERGDVGTAINVNVEGNVFDKKETGLAIADAINEAFGSNGVTIAQAGTA